MAILDIFKKKKEIERKVIEKKIEEKPVAKKRPVFICNIVSAPHISEKASGLAEKNQYVFNVFAKANKNQVKKAVQSIYSVDVLAVNIINIHPKARRLGRSEGFKKGFKKAIVRIKEGQKIEVI